MSSANPFSKHDLLSSQTRLLQILTAYRQFSKISKDGDGTTSSGQAPSLLDSCHGIKVFFLKSSRNLFFQLMSAISHPSTMHWWLHLVDDLLMGAGILLVYPPKPPKSKDEITLSIPYRHCVKTPKG